MLDRLSGLFVGGVHDCLGCGETWFRGIARPGVGAARRAARTSCLWPDGYNRPRRQTRYRVLDGAGLDRRFASRHRRRRSPHKWLSHITRNEFLKLVIGSERNPVNRPSIYYLDAAGELHPAGTEMPRGLQWRATASPPSFSPVSQQVGSGETNLRVSPQQGCGSEWTAALPLFVQRATRGWAHRETPPGFAFPAANAMMLMNFGIAAYCAQAQPGR